MHLNRQRISKRFTSFINTMLDGSTKSSLKSSSFIRKKTKYLLELLVNFFLTKVLPSSTKNLLLYHSIAFLEKERKSPIPTEIAFSERMFYEDNLRQAVTNNMMVYCFQ
jgi:hypothetical protein